MAKRGFRRQRQRPATRAKSARSAGLGAIVILMATGFYWALIQIFTAITLQCETYFAF
ncbi:MULTISPECIES: hypothetical protein [Hyphobacterium]|uniref:Uncharacterized protein n=1 Tax=Hyphobacterium vulgare TaxID=1736751 RepID=A0ABV6ZXK6_9PROT